ncbi:MAG: hypothetical protein ABFS39_04475, partial [Pseudomonadota bacterium]
FVAIASVVRWHGLAALFVVIPWWFWVFCSRSSKPSTPSPGLQIDQIPSGLDDVVIRHLQPEKCRHTWIE